MKDLIKECDELSIELQKFDESLISFGEAIDDDRLEIFEDRIKFQLPTDFKYLYKKHNGIVLSGTEIYGIDKKFRGLSLDEVYEFEHNDEIFNKMPNEFLPFSPDGRGNHYCLNLSKLKNGICPVVFWQHDFIYENLLHVEECNNDFIGWIKEVMIDWTLEDYDGSYK